MFNKLFNKISVAADNASDVLAKRHANTINKYSNPTDFETKYLDIPIIGGFLYVFNCYSRAQYVVKQHKVQAANNANFRKVVRNRNNIKRSIQNQLDTIILNSTVETVTVPPEYLVEFLDVVKDYPVTLKQIDDCKFVVVVKEMSL